MSDRGDSLIERGELEMEEGRSLKHLERPSRVLLLLFLVIALLGLVGTCIRS